MAADPDLARRVRALLADEAVREQSMFGGLAFLVGEHMAVKGVSTGWRQGPPPAPSRHWGEAPSLTRTFQLHLTAMVDF